MAFFKEVMERSWEFMRLGLLDVEMELETALESHEECESVDERRRLCLAGCVSCSAAMR